VLLTVVAYVALHAQGPSTPSSDPEREAVLTVIQATVRERMWNPEVRIRGFIASVWTPYDFWSDGKFSHCGVDAFNLIKTDEGWRIAGGTYTVERECEPESVRTVEAIDGTMRDELYNSPVGALNADPNTVVRRMSSQCLWLFESGTWHFDCK